MTLKAGRISSSWHTLHVTMVVMTRGWWALVYAAHVVIWSLNRPTVTVEVPAGGRIEYRDGYPNVLAEDEYLVPRTREEKVRTFLPWLVPIGLVVLLFVVALNRP
ncbi:hypothetical protein QEZ54_28970 [Catellatospora sp. KI3]|uniref:hypothetical protein n=1 Tax=Catellatospora sp. KI3 TaxID=3041620 RepID=UPI0024824AE6|nr:hypothetical protein [Catellatospora sp. KI3]MDI1465009.1 hypothetical protein [Catellatospora sp. KI3]